MEPTLTSSQGGFWSTRGADGQVHILPYGQQTPVTDPGIVHILPVGNTTPVGNQPVYSGGGGGFNEQTGRPSVYPSNGGQMHILPYGNPIPVGTQPAQSNPFVPVGYVPPSAQVQQPVLRSKSFWNPVSAGNGAVTSAPTSAIARQIASNAARGRTRQVSFK